MSSERAFLPIDTITTISSIEDFQPIQRFRLFTEEDFHSLVKLEYFWGLNRGELDLWSKFNSVSVRADIAQLLLRKDFALVPTPDILEKMLEMTKDNFKHREDRRCCFEAIVIQDYEYRLLPLNENGPPLFIVDRNATSLRRIDFPYSDLPPLKLSLYPFYAIMHAGEGFFRKKSTRDPIYSSPIRQMVTFFSITVPREFYYAPNNHLPSNSPHHYDSDSSNSDDTAYDHIYSQFVPFYEEDGTAKVHSWIQESEISAPDESIVSNVHQVGDYDLEKPRLAGRVHGEGNL